MGTLMVTGGAGFIGSNFVLHHLRNRDSERVVNFDALTYAGNLENLKQVEDDARYTFVKGDITDPEKVADTIRRYDVDRVINFAAESHVDRSILDPSVFITTNVLGTQVLLDAARAAGVMRFVQVSTDEVYGSLGQEGYFTEETSIKPNSPYSASKAGADFLVRAAFRTYGFPAIVTRCSNNYGPFQFPEKLIPLMISNAVEDQSIPVYGDGLNVRDWIYVEDHCSALAMVLAKGEPGLIYNIGGESEKTNLDVVSTTLRLLGKTDDLIEFVKDRPGHDRRYAIDCSFIKKELGWKPSWSFEDGLRETVEWYVSNPEWWQRVKDGRYLEYYKAQYGDRLES